MVFLLLFLLTNGIRSTQEFIYSSVPENTLLPLQWIFPLQVIGIVLTTVGVSLFIYFERQVIFAPTQSEG